ncbi:MAG TPA: SUF system NifU family Fe-S cluster assembly protein [Crenotrichaceae bacterium]|nr:SUF system NifU family Fe-S cluster assembly protein [Crenotrichaceae bacterium]
MQDEMRNLYQEVIFDHNRNPRNFHVMENANRIVDGYNPLCGDRLTLYLLIDDNEIIQNASFQGEGCAISTASVSLMTEMIKGKTVKQAEQLFEQFHNITTSHDDEIKLEELGKLAVLAGVRDYPSRVKCATLPWHTMSAAVKNEATTVTTE